MSRLVIVHDVLGTLFSLSSPIEELQAIFADQFKAAESPAILAELIIMVSIDVLPWLIYLLTRLIFLFSNRTGIMQLNETLLP
jgi:hypothetical protein